MYSNSVSVLKITHITVQDSATQGAVGIAIGRKLIQFSAGALLYVLSHLFPLNRLLELIKMAEVIQRTLIIYNSRNWLGLIDSPEPSLFQADLQQ